MNKLLTSLLFILSYSLVSAQLIDDFSDGNFTTNPEWTGNVDRFIVNADLQLQLNAVEAGNAYLSTAYASTSLDNKEWRFFFRMGFSPSNNNRVSVYIVSDQPDLSVDLTGYYLRVGENGTDDTIELYRQTGATSTLVARGENGIFDGSPSTAAVRVRRDDLGNWEIALDKSGGSNYSVTATGFDDTYTTSTNTGVRCFYTVGNITNFRFNNFYFGEIQNLPPALTSIQVMTLGEIRLTFNQVLDIATAENLNTYSIDNGATILSATYNNADFTVTLEFAEDLLNGTNYAIGIDGLIGSDGISLDNFTQEIFVFIPDTPEKGEVVFTEIFSRVDPQLGLPQAQFIEIFNTTENKIFDLQSWKFIRGSTEYTLGSKPIAPGEYVILTNTTNAALYEPFGKTLDFAMPTLNLNSDTITLVSNTDLVLDALRYSETWYRDTDKARGGFSRELINPDLCFDQANWTGSNAAAGGTPGTQNSVFDPLFVGVAPKLIRARGISPTQIRLTFDKAMDAATLDQGIVNFLDGGFGSDAVAIDTNWPNSIIVTTDSNFPQEQTFNVQVSGFKDCNGNTMSTRSIKYVFDLTPPELHEIIPAGNTQLLVSFKERLNQASAQVETNYSVDNNIFNARTAVLVEDSVVLLTFANAMVAGESYELTVVNVADTVLNAITEAKLEFVFEQVYIPQPKDLVFTEIMANPNTTTQLPNEKYVEILNTSDQRIVLTGIKLADRTFTTELRSGYLEPGEYGIFVSATAKPFFTQYGKAIAVPSFSSSNFSPNATDDDLSIINQLGQQIDFIAYNNNWINDEARRSGYALEVINPFLPCSGRFNWDGTTANSGGTPGQQNTRFDTSVTGPSPNLVGVQTAASNALRLLFDIAMDESALMEADYLLNEAVAPNQITPAADLRSVTIAFTNNLVHNESYQVVVTDLIDCNGNEIAINTIDFVFDNEAPILEDAVVYNTTVIDLVFDEALATTGLTSPQNYTIGGGIGNPTTVALIGNRTIRLTFTNTLSENTPYTLTVNSVRDLATNELANFTTQVQLLPRYIPTYRELVITELNPRPSAALGLPNAEWVEILNTTDQRIILSNYRLSNDSDFTTLGLAFINPGEYLLICPTNAVTTLSEYGRAYGVSNWRTLKVREDIISLRTHEDTLIDQVPYTEQWSGDLSKYNQSGYSLEIINPAINCSGQFNWTLTTEESGGTPGRQNAVFDQTNTNESAKIMAVKTAGADQIKVFFDFPMNEASLNSGQFILQNEDIEVIFREVVAADFSSIILTYNEELINGKAYILEVSGVTDCNGNTLADNTFSFEFDNLPPQLTDLIIYDGRNLELKFDEALQVGSVADTATWQLNLNIGRPTSVNLINPTTVRLVLGADLIENISYVLTIAGLEDLNGNSLTNFTVNITRSPRFIPQFSQLLITEIMSKPVAGRPLPNSEWIEIYNTTDQRILLNGFQISNDAAATNALSLAYIEPNEYLIICPSNAVSSLSAYGRAYGVGNWRTLKVRGDEVSLLDPNQGLVHRVRYSDSWYRDPDKYDEGGYTLEMIDVENPCGEAANWKVSEDTRGGTPAMANSVQASNPDIAGPKLILANAPTETEVVIRFNEKLDVSNLLTSYFTISDNIQAVLVEFITPEVVKITLNQALQARRPYQLTVTGITDCAGNLIQSSANETTFALVEPAAQGDIILNEILFHPPVGGVEFVELYNTSPKYINLKDWAIAGRSGTVRRITELDLVIDPQQFLVITADPEKLKEDYPQTLLNRTTHIAQMPSFASTLGTVFLMNAQLDTLEYFEYSADMHNPALRDRRGVSLERISPLADPNDAASWASASKAVSYATPGFINSQTKDGELIAGEILIDPPTFAPGSPGRGFTLINYDLDDTGSIANITVMDMRGRPIKTIANNDVLGRRGFFRWDGDDDTGNRVRAGYYIVYIEIFTDEGKMQRYRKKVAVATP